MRPAQGTPPATAATVHGRVLCFGNPLHGDDGFGPAVAQRLQGCALPAGWTVHDVGTRGLDALALLADCPRAILVDALAPGRAPGHLRELSPQEVAPEGGASAHASQGLGYCLRALAALHADGPPAPALRVLGAEMDALRRFDPRLSPAMAQAVDTAARCVQAWTQGNAAA